MSNRNTPHRRAFDQSITTLLDALAFPEAMQSISENIAGSGHKVRMAEVLHDSVLLCEGPAILRDHRRQKDADRGLLEPPGSESPGSREPREGSEAVVAGGGEDRGNAQRESGLTFPARLHGSRRIVTGDATLSVPLEETRHKSEVGLGLFDRHLDSMVMAGDDQVHRNPLSRRRIKP